MNSTTLIYVFIYVYFKIHDRKSFFLQGDLLSSEVSETDSAPHRSTARTGNPQFQESLRHWFSVECAL